MKKTNHFIIPVIRPTDNELIPAIAKAGKVQNFAEGHILNTPSALQKAAMNKDITAICFDGSSVVRMFTGYGDGLICCWEVLYNGEVK